MRYLFLFIMFILWACSEPPTYRVFTMTSSGDFIETIGMTQSRSQAISIFNMKFQEREDCTENCEDMFQQLYIAVEPCRNEYGITICHEIEYVRKW